MELFFGLLPFYELCDSELVVEFDHEKLNYDNFCNMRFDPFEITDKFNRRTNPNLLIDVTSMEKIRRCKYFSLEEFGSLTKSESFGSNINGISINCRSLLKHYDEILLDFDITNVKYDIISFVETWLNTNTTQLFKIANYNAFHITRNGRGGGVAVYIRDNYQTSVIKELSMIDPCIESIFINMSVVSNGCFIVGTVYRPPHSDILDFLAKLENILSHITSNYPTATILMQGDYNIDMMKCYSNNLYNDYFCRLLSYSMWPLILRPTRVTHCSATLIDNIFCNNIKALNMSGIILSDVSDHFAVFSSFSINKAKPAGYVEISRRDMKQDNLSMLKVSISNYDWNSLKANQSVNELYNNFSDKIANLYDAHCPVKTFKVKIIDRDKPYINGQIKQVLKEKHKLQKKFNKRPVTYGREYRALRNRLNSMIRSAKAAYFKQRLADGSDNNRNSWKILDDMLGNKNNGGLPDKFIIDGAWIDDPHTIANRFNSHFCSIGETLSLKFSNAVNGENNYINYLDGRVDTVFSFNPITEEEIKNIILCLNQSSPGIDNIPMTLFSSNIGALANIITHICNKSLEHGIFPQRLAVAIVTCIYKKGGAHQIENYRAISLLNAFSKILEKAVSARLIDYFLSNNYFAAAQFGFIPGKSTELAVQHIVNDIYGAFDRGETAIGVFLDLAKAFDSLDRTILSKKLQYYGITGTTLAWFNSYLSCRKQHVRFINVLSDVKENKFGVPQGGVISATLFLLYILMI